jgi:hypothetical protein
MTENNESNQEQNLYAECRKVLEKIVMIAHSSGANITKDVFSKHPPAIERGMMTFELSNKMKVSLLIDYEPLRESEHYLRINLNVIFLNYRDTGLLKGLEEDLMLDCCKFNDIKVTPDLLTAQMIMLEQGLSYGIESVELRTSFRAIEAEDCFELPETLFLDIRFRNGMIVRVSKFPTEIREESACVNELFSRFMNMVGDGADQKRREEYGTMTDGEIVLAQTGESLRRALNPNSRRRYAQHDLNVS